MFALKQVSLKFRARHLIAGHHPQHGEPYSANLSHLSPALTGFDRTALDGA